MNTIIVIIIFVIFLDILTDGIYEYYKYKQFKKKLIVGSKLFTIVRILGNEFDQGTEFHVTVIDETKNQVRIQYTDGSIEIRDKANMFNEGWKFEN